MPNIEIKFAIDEKVYCAEGNCAQVKETCPDCLGEAVCLVKMRNGEEIETGCPTCYTVFGSSGFITTRKTEHNIVIRTIGEIGLEHGIGRYMCHETGVGSGQIYTDDNLFKTKEEAGKECEKQEQELMKTIAKRNFKKPEVYADKIRSSLGYSREDALKLEREMRQWCGLVKGKRK